MELLLIVASILSFYLGYMVGEYFFQGEPINKKDDK